MTEKEFENLKVGDKVFCIANWWDGTEEHKAYELEVKGKEESKGIVNTYCERGKEKCSCAGHCLSRYSVFLTKTEAWEDCIKSKEEAIERLENQKAGEQRMLDRYRAGLAKAKEEEDTCWITDSGEVRKVRKSDYPCYIHYATDHEAYIALARYYEAKLVETEAKLEEVKNHLSNMPATPKREEEKKEREAEQKEKGGWDKAIKEAKEKYGYGKVEK